MRQKGAVWIVAGAVVLAVVLFLTRQETSYPNVSGRYSTYCCGTLEIESSRIVAGGNEVPFELGKDKLGLFALPKTFLGVEHGHIVSTSGHPDFLRFDDEQRPSSISLPNLTEGGSTKFELELSRRGQSLSLTNSNIRDD